MSVWLPVSAPLSGSGGALVSLSIDVQPRYLESLLEALARVSFPVNPQIYHEAAMVYVYPDGHSETEAVTLVEFPAYTVQVDEVREALTAYGFDASSIHTRDMLAEIHAELEAEPAPTGSNWTTRYRRKRKLAAGAAYQP